MKTSSYFPSKGKKALEKFFDKSSMSRLAKSCGFGVRKAQKITAYNFVAGFLLCCAKGANSLGEWARQISLLSGKPLSKQALWERIHEGTVAFVRSLLEKLLAKEALKGVKAALFQPFQRVILHDSTTLHLPDGLRAVFPGSVVRGMQKAIARIQSIIELKRMRFVDFALGAYTQNDQSASPCILSVVKKGDLLIRDLGYFVLQVLQQLTSQQVYVLSRLRYGVKLSDWWGRLIDLRELLKKGKRVERWVHIGKKNPVWVRLVMIPLPEEQAAERVRKAKQDRDKRLHHDKQCYRWLRYNVFITTVGKDIWNTAEVARAYGVRWHIEVIFKSWKSGFHMQDLLQEQCTEPCRVKTTIYLLLFFLCLFMQKLYVRYLDKVQKQTGKFVSLLRLTALFFRNMIELLVCSPQKLKEQIILYGCYERRNDRTNMIELINQFKN